MNGNASVRIRKVFSRDSQLNSRVQHQILCIPLHYMGILFLEHLFHSRYIAQFHQVMLPNEEMRDGCAGHSVPHEGSHVVGKQFSHISILHQIHVQCPSCM